MQNKNQSIGNVDNVVENIKREQAEKLAKQASELNIEPQTLATP